MPREQCGLGRCGAGVGTIMPTLGRRRRTYFAVWWVRVYVCMMLLFLNDILFIHICTMLSTAYYFTDVLYKNLCIPRCNSSSGILFGILCIYIMYIYIYTYIYISVYVCVCEMCHIVLHGEFYVFLCTLSEMTNKTCTIIKNIQVLV